MTAPTWTDTRQAIYTRLDAQLTADVWSPKAPQNAQGESSTPFPYVVIVQATEIPWNTSGTRGAEFVVQIDGFARSGAGQSSEQVIAALHSSVREALEYFTLSIANSTWVDTEFETMSLGWSDEGKTRRFISMYRITLDGTA
jgi:hypothetical protein